MNQLFHFQSLPSLSDLQRRLWHLQPPFSCDIRQGETTELIDADTAGDLHEFLTHEDYGIVTDQPFTVDIEEIKDDPENSWDEHPALTIAERN